MPDKIIATSLSALEKYYSGKAKNSEYKSFGQYVLYIDFMFLLFGVFLLITVIILFLINPPGEDSTNDSKTPCFLMVNMIWDKSLKSDIDLWVYARDHDARPVGYSHLGDDIFTLLQDDLGRKDHEDEMEINQEFACTTGLPDTQYIINAHLFRHQDNRQPIDVLFKIELKTGKTFKPVELFTIKKTLTTQGEQVTVVAFRTDENKRVIEDSILKDKYYDIRTFKPAIMGP